MEDPYEEFMVAKDEETERRNLIEWKKRFQLRAGRVPEFLSSVAVQVMLLLADE